MDNAAEALKLAAWVLIFVLALSLSMNAFAQARESIDNILVLSDRDYITTYIDKGNGKTLRIVGAETIVPTIYRAYRENFKVRISYDSSITDQIPLYQVEKLESNGYTKTKEAIYTIDLENQNLSDETIKEYFIKRILFGKNAIENNYESKLASDIVLNTREPYKSGPEENDFINSQDGLYGFIIKSGAKITATEELGVYYQEEMKGTLIESTANKTEKRVVTYTLHRGD